MSQFEQAGVYPAFFPAYVAPVNVGPRTQSCLNSWLHCQFLLLLFSLPSSTRRWKWRVISCQSPEALPFPAHVSAANTRKQTDFDPMINYQCSSFGEISRLWSSRSGVAVEGQRAVLVTQSSNDLLLELVFDDIELHNVYWSLREPEFVEFIQ